MSRLRRRQRLMVRWARYRNRYTPAVPRSIAGGHGASEAIMFGARAGSWFYLRSQCKKRDRR